ncbi:MAG: amidohydrolase family protein [Persicimonas sp.]
MRQTITILTTLAIFALAATAHAQTAFTGAEVHTVSGEVIEDGVVVVGEDGLIAQVGPADTEVPAGADVVGAAGKVITPGFVDAQTRLGVVELWSEQRTRDYDAGGEDPVRAAFRVADGFNPNSTAIPVTRSGGVTSALVVPGGGLVSGQAAWASLGPVSGSKAGVKAHIETEAAAVVINHGESGARAAGGSRGSAMESLRELYDDVRFYGDNLDDYNKNRSRKLAASRLDLLVLSRTADGRLPVMFRVNRSSDISAVLRLADEVGVRPIIVGGAEAWQVADKLAERQVPVIVDPLSNLPTRFATLGARADNAAILASAGVPVILSTFGTHNVRKLRQVAGNAVRAGMGYDAALEAVTRSPARALGRDDIGTIEVGKRADLVVWSGDPFELSTKVDAFYVGGQSVELDNRQKQLFERYRQLPRREAAAPAD